MSENDKLSKEVVHTSMAEDAKHDSSIPPPDFGRELSIPPELKLAENLTVIEVFNCFFSFHVIYARFFSHHFLRMGGFIL